MQTPIPLYINNSSYITFYINRNYHRVRPNSFGFGYLRPKITLSAKLSASAKISWKVLPKSMIEST